MVIIDNGHTATRFGFHLGVMGDEQVFVFELGIIIGPYVFHLLLVGGQCLFFGREGVVDVAVV